MNIKLKIMVGILGMSASAALFAQGTTPPATPGSQSTDPSAASTPHQRAATKSSTDESTATSSSSSPDAASTPSQKDQLKKKHKPKPPAPAASP